MNWIEVKKYFAEDRLEKATFFSLALFVFIIPYSRAVTSFMIFWLPLLTVYTYGFSGIFEKLKKNEALVFFSIYILFMTTSLLWTQDFSQGLDSLRKMFMVSSLTFSISLLMKKEWRKTLLFIFLLSLFVSALLSLCHIAEFVTIKGKPSTILSPWMSHIHYSVFMAVCAIVSLHFILSKKRVALYSLFFIVFMSMLLFTKGRTGQLGFLVSLFILLWMHYKNQIKYLLPMFVLIPFLIFGAYKNIDIFQTRIDKGIEDISKVKTGNFQSSWGNRVGFLILGAEIIKEDPLLGSGVGGYMKAAENIVNKRTIPLLQGQDKTFLKRHFHNQYLMVALQGGMLGLGLFLLMLYKLYKVPFKDREYKNIGLLVLTVFCVGFIAEPLLRFQNPLSLFAFFTAMTISLFYDTNVKEEVK